MEKHLEHEGTVTSISGSTMVVRIVSTSACGGCAAKSYCVPYGDNNREILIENFSGNFVLGERVTVIMKESLGFIALFVGYVTPFLVVMATLITSYLVTSNELVSGLLSLLVLVPYYFTIKLLNPKITKTFGFSVQKTVIT